MAEYLPLNAFKKQCVDAIIFLDEDPTVSREEFHKSLEDLLLFTASVIMPEGETESITIKDDARKDGVLQIILSKEPMEKE